MDVKGAKILKDRLAEAEAQRWFVPSLVVADAAAADEKPAEPESHDDSPESQRFRPTGT